MPAWIKKKYRERYDNDNTSQIIINVKSRYNVLNTSKKGIKNFFKKKEKEKKNPLFS